MTESIPPVETAPLETAPTPTTEPSSLLSPVEPTTPAPAPFAAMEAADVAALFGTNPPEGEMLQKVTETFSDLQLTKENAGKLTALYGTMQQEAEKAVAATWNETIKTWQDQSKASPDFGGDKFDSSLAKAKQVVDDYGDQSFKEMLSVTGVGNHPALIGFILKLASALPGEAAPAPTSTTMPERDLASRMFPSTRS